MSRPELNSMQVFGPTDVGWDVSTPPNEYVDEYGYSVPSAETYGERDPYVPSVREFDHPEVAELREYLRQHNGIRDLEICDPSEVDRAARIFHRDGFVVVKDLLTPTLLRQMREVCARYLREILAYPGRDGRRYMQESGRLPHRYCYGTTSASRQMMHDPIWVQMVDMSTSTPILTEIFGTSDYRVWGGGGDLSLPGAIEYQHLHTDGIDGQENFADRLQAARHKTSKIPVEGDFHDLDFRTQRLVMDYANPGATINFLMCDLTFENGPIRQIPGTHTVTEVPPVPTEEPEWMRLSTLVGAPAGSGVIRDTRAWHGATPNLSREIRAMPSIEYSAGWGSGKHFLKTMPHELWETLTPHAQKVCQHIKQAPGVWPFGAGFMHPLAGVLRDRYVDEANGTDTSKTVRTDARSAGKAVRVFNGQ